MMQDANVDIILTNSIYEEKAANVPCILIDPSMEMKKFQSSSRHYRMTLHIFYILPDQQADQRALLFTIEMFATM